MQNEEVTKDFSIFSPTAIATGLLNLELTRENPTGFERDSLKLSDNERRKRFGARLKLLRQALGLKQADLAEKLKVSTPAIAVYETGKREPSLKNLIQLSRALNTTTDWLLGEPLQK